MNTLVTFTDEEINYARQGAKEIYEESRRKGLNPGNATGRGYEFKNEILGVIGEWAYAKVMDFPFEFNINTFKRPDVGNAHIRSSHVLGHLILRPGDVPGLYVFVLVADDYSWARVIGQFDGAEAMTDKYWHNKEEVANKLRRGDAAWLVNHKELKPIEKAA